MTTNTTADFHDTEPQPEPDCDCTPGAQCDECYYRDHHEAGATPGAQRGAMVMEHYGMGLGLLLTDLAEWADDQGIDLRVAAAHAYTTALCRRGTFDTKWKPL